MTFLAVFLVSFNNRVYAAAKSWAFYLPFLSVGLWLITVWLVHSVVFHKSWALSCKKLTQKFFKKPVFWTISKPLSKFDLIICQVM